MVKPQSSVSIAKNHYHSCRITRYLTKKQQFITVVSKVENVVPWYREDYADFADFCFKMFGDRVKNWFTFNEPKVVASLGYDNGYFAPLRCSKPYGNCTAGNSGTEPYIVAHNLILCHASAVQRYREKYQVRFTVLYMLVS